jgi:hypothetical protein
MTLIDVSDMQYLEFAARFERALNECSTVKDVKRLKPSLIMLGYQGFYRKSNSRHSTYNSIKDKYWSAMTRLIKEEADGQS